MNNNRSPLQSYRYSTAASFSYPIFCRIHNMKSSTMKVERFYYNQILIVWNIMTTYQ